MNDFAGSAFSRVVLADRAGRPAAADPEAAIEVTDLTARLAHRVPVLHDISAGGMAVALAEICFRSGIGAVLEVTSWQELFDESPHRVLAVAPAGFTIETEVPARIVGRLGGDHITFGTLGSVDLRHATAVWRAAIPRRMN